MSDIALDVRKTLNDALQRTVAPEMALLYDLPEDSTFFEAVVAALVRRACTGDTRATDQLLRLLEQVNFQTTFEDDDFSLAFLQFGEKLAADYEKSHGKND